MAFEMVQRDRVWARSRKRESYFQRHAVTPESKKETLLVATIRLLPVSFPTSAAKRKGPRKWG